MHNLYSPTSRFYVTKWLIWLQLKLREHISPTALSDVVHPLSGTRWTLKNYSVALLVDLNAVLKHYFSVRLSVARLELSASASEVIRHAGAI